jgi:hypothetical protein
MGGKGNGPARQGSGGITPSSPSRAARPAGSTAKRGGKGQAPGKTQGIPPAVANRMARRVGLATGIPTVLGMATFIVSYVVVSRGLLDIPPVATLLTSGAFFLLGLVGLSYGVLSASWEDNPGSLLGFEQIGVNISRLRSSFKRPPAAS